MKEYIEREAARDLMERALEDDWEIQYANDRLRDIPAADVVEVVRCRECKHRPTKPEKYDDGLDLVFPDEACPCYCDDDPFYSWHPSDDWFCPRGERKGGDE